jgi:hypothetical protein
MEVRNEQIPGADLRSVKSHAVVSDSQQHHTAFPIQATDTAVLDTQLRHARVTQLFLIHS